MTNSFWGEAPIAIAHRGGDSAGADKENTLEAFKSAQKLGYSYIETDVVLAASGELILVHGSRHWLQASVYRDFTRGTLQKMSLKQVRAIVRPGGAEVPTLSEALQAFPKIKFILDLKTDETVEPLAKLISKLKAADRVCITGFDYERSQKFKRACGDMEVCVGVTVGRGLRFRNINQIMLKSGRLTSIDAAFLHHSLVSPPMIGLVHRRGLKAIVWTANSKLGIKHAIKSGADGVISDKTELLKELVINRRAKPVR